MSLKSIVFAPGSRVLVRGEEWLVRRADLTPAGDRVLSVSGLSPLVRNRDAKFIESIEAMVEPIRIVDPKETIPVADSSPYYRDTRLFLESLLRQTVPSDSRLCIGHKGAMDVLPYQLDPARLALEQPRQRILIADAVGLGKTIECGVLLSELIRRGRGRRILVLTVKSMMTQFQKELWSRFSIPLVRLDSEGLQRVRGRIPTNHNPFHYFDKTIISIDTIKQDGEYRHHLEEAWWDVIVIDEAHNVAERSGNSLRAKVARLLASRSDSLILLSATPHDGRKESFASIMNMLNPTAIKDSSDYGREDIEGLFIRRFKKDIKDQVRGQFPERTVAIRKHAASDAEEKAYAFLADLRFQKMDQQSATGDLLYRTLLEKALFSSPAACLDTIEGRMRRTASRKDASDFAGDLEHLNRLAQLVRAIEVSEFSKYQTLLGLLSLSGGDSLGWSPKNTDDRLVIFTERIATLEFLKKNLPQALGLRENQVAVLKGDLTDMEQQDVVEAFGNEASPVRLLLASDVASEGINLHYLCHRMIHFDIPWSLLTFQQRNGRIDRYGQAHQPQLHYLLTESDHPKIRGDQRILEILIAKDLQVQENIGDPSEFTGLHSSDEEEAAIGKAMEAGVSPEKFDATFGTAPETDDPFLAALMGLAPSEPTASPSIEAQTHEISSLFSDDFAWGKAAFQFAQSRAGRPWQIEMVPEAREIHFHLPNELLERLRRLPSDIVPDDKQWILTTDRSAVMREINTCRKEDQRWPRVQLLWQQHPVMEWLQDKILYAFGRHDAPVVQCPSLVAGDTIILCTGILPNRKGHPLVQRWQGVHFSNGAFSGIMDLPQVIQATHFDSETIPNPADASDFTELQNLIPPAVDAIFALMRESRQDFERLIRPELNRQLARLEAFRDAKWHQLELKFEGMDSKRDAETRKVGDLHSEYSKWIRDTLETEEQPFIRIATIFTGKP